MLIDCGAAGRLRGVESSLSVCRINGFIARVVVKGHLTRLLFLNK